MKKSYEEKLKDTFLYIVNNFDNIKFLIMSDEFQNLFFLLNSYTCVGFSCDDGGCYDVEFNDKIFTIILMRLYLKSFKFYLVDNLYNCYLSTNDQKLVINNKLTKIVQSHNFDNNGWCKCCFEYIESCVINNMSENDMVIKNII